MVLQLVNLGLQALMIGLRQHSASYMIVVLLLLYLYPEPFELQCILSYFPCHGLISDEKEDCCVVITWLLYAYLG